MGKKSIALQATSKHPTFEEGTVYVSSGASALADLYRKFAVPRKDGDVEELGTVELETANLEAADHQEQEKPKRKTAVDKQAARGRYNRRDLRAR